MSKNTVKYEGAFTSDDRLAVNQNFADVGLATAQTDVTSSTTLVNATGMVTGSLVAGRTYRFKVNLSTSTGASGGLKVAFKQGTASMLTSIEAVSRGFTASAVAVQHSTTATDAASLFASTSLVINLEIEGTLVVALPGTLQLQFAQNVSDGTTTSVLLGSQMYFIEVV